MLTLIFSDVNSPSMANGTGQNVEEMIHEALMNWEKAQSALSSFMRQILGM